MAQSHNSSLIDPRTSSAVADTAAVVDEKKAGDGDLLRSRIDELKEDEAFAEQILEKINTENKKLLYEMIRESEKLTIDDLNIILSKAEEKKEEEVLTLVNNAIAVLNEYQDQFDNSIEADACTKRITDLIKIQDGEEYTDEEKLNARNELIQLKTKIKILDNLNYCIDALKGKIDVDQYLANRAELFKRMPIYSDLIQKKITNENTLHSKNARRIQKLINKCKETLKLINALKRRIKILKDFSLAEGNQFESSLGALEKQIEEFIKGLMLLSHLEHFDKKRFKSSFERINEIIVEHDKKVKLQVAFYQAEALKQQLGEYKIKSENEPGIIESTEQTKTRIDPILGEAGKKVLFKDQEPENTSARQAFIKFLMEHIPEIERYEFKGDQESNPRHSDPSKGAISLKKLLGKEGVELYKKALIEERKSEAFKRAVFASAYSEAELLPPGTIIPIVGPSSVGKSFIKNSMVREARTALGESKEQRGVVAVDGAIERETSQIRKLVNDTSLMLGWSGIEDLHEQSKALSLKHEIEEAALEAGLSIVIPTTHMGESELLKYEQDGYTVVLGQVTGPEEEEIEHDGQKIPLIKSKPDPYNKLNTARQKGVSTSATDRSFCRDQYKPEPKDRDLFKNGYPNDLNHKAKYESKKYNPYAFKLAKYRAKKLKKAYLKAKAIKHKKIVINFKNDRIAIGQLSNGAWEIYEERNKACYQKLEVLALRAFPFDEENPFRIGKLQDGTWEEYNDSNKSNYTIIQEISNEAFVQWKSNAPDDDIDPILWLVKNPQYFNPVLATESPEPLVELKEDKIDETNKSKIEDLIDDLINSLLENKDGLNIQHIHKTAIELYELSRIISGGHKGDISADNIFTYLSDTISTSLYEHDPSIDSYAIIKANSKKCSENLTPSHEIKDDDEARKAMGCELVLAIFQDLSSHDNYASLSKEGLQRLNEAKWGNTRSLAKCTSSARFSPQLELWAKSLLNKSISADEPSSPSVNQSFDINTFMNSLRSAQHIFDDNGDLTAEIAKLIPEELQESIVLILNGFYTKAKELSFTPEQDIQPWYISMLGSGDYDAGLKIWNEIRLYANNKADIPLLVYNSICLLLSESLTESMKKIRNDPSNSRKKEIETAFEIAFLIIQKQGEIEHQRSEENASNVHDTPLYAKKTGYAQGRNPLLDAHINKQIMQLGRIFDTPTKDEISDDLKNWAKQLVTKYKFIPSKKRNKISRFFNKRSLSIESNLFTQSNNAILNHLHSIIPHITKPGKRECSLIKLDNLQNIDIHLSMAWPFTMDAAYIRCDNLLYYACKSTNEFIQIKLSNKQITALDTEFKATLDDYSNNNNDRPLNSNQLSRITELTGHKFSPENHSIDPVFDANGRLAPWLAKLIPPGFEALIHDLLQDIYSKANAITFDSNGELQQWLAMATKITVPDKNGPPVELGLDHLISNYSKTLVEKNLATAVMAALREALRSAIPFHEQSEEYEAINIFLMILDSIIEQQQLFFTKSLQILKEEISTRHPNLERDLALGDLLSTFDKMSEHLIKDPLMSIDQLTNIIKGTLAHYDKEKENYLKAESIQSEEVEDQALKSQAGRINSSTLYKSSLPKSSLSAEHKGQSTDPPEKHSLVITKHNKQKIKVTVEDKLTQDNKPHSDLTHLDEALDTAKILASLAYKARNIQGQLLLLFESEIAAQHFFTEVFSSLRTNYGVISKENLEEILRTKLGDKLTEAELQILAKNLFKAYKNATEQLDPYPANAQTHHTDSYAQNYFPCDALIRLAKFHVDSFKKFCGQPKPKIVINANCWEPNYVRALMLYCGMRGLPQPSYDNNQGWEVDSISSAEQDNFNQFYAERFGALDEVHPLEQDLESKTSVEEKKSELNDTTEDESEEEEEENAPGSPPSSPRQPI